MNSNPDVVVPGAALSTIARQTPQPASSTPEPNRALVGAVFLVIALGMTGGATQFARPLFAEPRDAPALMSAERALNEPLDSWVEVEGRISVKSMASYGGLLRDAVVVFQLEGARNLVFVEGDPSSPLMDPGLWTLAGLLGAVSKSKPAAAPSDEARTYLRSPHRFAGVITEPGAGFSRSNEVTVPGTKVNISGVFGYCTGRQCPSPKVVLVGERPAGRLVAGLETFGLALVALVALYLGITVLRAKAIDQAPKPG
jgi:hypothetical protein